MVIFMGIFSGFFSSGSVVSHILGEISSSKGGGGSSSGYSRSIIGNESCIPKIDIKVYPKDSDTIIGKLVETIDELEQTKEDAKAEALEIMTDGVWEMGIKKNSDYKTSFEIKEEAEKKIEDARYAAQKKQMELQTLAKRVDEKIKELYKKKLKMADLINRHIGTEPSEPFMEAENYSGITTGQGGAQSCVVRLDGKGLTNFLMQNERKEQAKQ